MVQQTFQTFRVSQAVKYQFIRWLFAALSGRKEQRDNNLIDLKSGRGLQTGQSLPQSSYLLGIPPTSSSCFEDRLGWGWALLLISYQFSHLSPHCLMHAGSVVTMVIHQRHSCISIANIHQLPHRVGAVRRSSQQEAGLTGSSARHHHPHPNCFHAHSANTHIKGVISACIVSPTALCLLPPEPPPPQHKAYSDYLCAHHREYQPNESQAASLRP